MKNLYQYSAEEHPTKFVWDKFNEAKGQASASEVSDGKEALTTKISKELDELANDIKLSDTLDKDKILAKINEGGSDSEKYVQRTDGTMILKDRVNKEKVKITAGNVLKIKDRKGDEILKVDLNTNDVKKNVGFGIEKKEETPETDASKEFKKKIETLDGNIEDMQEEDLVSLEGKIRNLRTEIKDNTELTAKERAHLLGLLNSLTARIVARRNVLKPNNNVEVVSDTMKEYERKIAGWESRLSGADKETLAALKIEGQALKKEINNIAEDKLSVKEKKTLTTRIDSLIKNIEVRENDLDKIDKKVKAYEKVTDAKKAIDEIDITGLSITTYNKTELTDSIKAAIKALEGAREAEKQFPEFKDEVDGLEAAFNHKNEQVELYKTGATEKDRVETIYQKQTDERLNEIDADITAKVKEHTDKLEKLAKTTSNPKDLPVEQLTIDQTKEPQSYEQIQKGMQAHRLDSMMMLKEVNFLQDCGQKFAEEIAGFEEEKSTFTIPNIARSLVASIAIVPGTLWDLGEWALDTGKRAGDRFGWLGFGDSRAEELQKKQGTFETEFTAKQLELEGKKTALDEYGDTLQKNSETLKTTAPEKVQTDVQESISKQLSDKGLDVSQEPWKGISAKLTVEFEKTATEKVQPAVDQLDTMVDGSVPELKNATDTSIKAASDTSDYIKDLDVHSATVLDMSVGFLTKNVAKGLDGVGDVLASNPVTGVLGGVCRAAGGFVEGVGMMLTDPWKVFTGMKTLVGLGPDGSFVDSWGNLGSALIGLGAFKKGIAKLKEGGFMNAMHGLGEITAGIGEAGGNIASFIFTGGTVGAVKGAGIAGRVANMSAKVGRFAGEVGAKIPSSILLRSLNIGKKLSKVGRPLGRAGDYALLPLRWGMKPLKTLNKLKLTKGTKVEKALTKAGRKTDVIFSPSKWVKIKPGSSAAVSKSQRLMKDVVKHRKKIAKLKKQRSAATGNEKTLLTREITKYEGKATKALQEARRLRELVPGSSDAIAKAVGLEKRVVNISRRLNDPALKLSQGERTTLMLKQIKLTKEATDLRTVITSPSVSRGFANRSELAKLKKREKVALAAVPFVYAGVANEKNNQRNDVDKIKETIPVKTEFERTPLADLDDSPASVNGAPASGPQQTVDQIKLDFEQTNEGRFRAFFNTGVSNVDRSTIKSLVKADLASDAEITIDGVVLQNGIEDVWNLFDPNKVGAVLTKLESKKEGTKNVISKIIIDKAK